MRTFYIYLQGCPEDGSSKEIRNTGIYLQAYSEFQPWKSTSSSSPPVTPQVSRCILNIIIIVSLVCNTYANNMWTARFSDPQQPKPIPETSSSQMSVTDIAEPENDRNEVASWRVVTLWELNWSGSAGFCYWQHCAPSVVSASRCQVVLLMIILRWQGEVICKEKLQTVR